MSKRRWMLAIGALLGLGQSRPVEAAGGPCPNCGAVHDAKPTAPRDAHDAGHPGCISPVAVSRDHGHHMGYYVGGGSALGGRERQLSEGTYGWDYAGLGWLPPESRLRLSRHN